MKSVIRKAAAILTAAAITVTGLSVSSLAVSEELLTQSVTAEYEASIAKPTYTVKGSAGVRKIRLKTSTKGATIYYTTDGTTPTTSSKKYTGTLIKVTKTTKIRAIAVKNGSKSSVMKKTIRIGTTLGDITGDGAVSETDYTRLKSYINGSTSYVCKDNADLDGNGKINKKDLTLLRQYIDGDIDEFPAADAVKSLEKPTMTVYKAYGGKKFKIESEDNADIYYTTNGSEPTRNSTRYTGMFIVSKDCTVKAVAYKNGEYSEVKSRSITVDKCQTPYADKDASVQYEDKVEVRLYCGTSSTKIYYTTDNTDPTKYGKLFSGKIELTTDTTLRFYSQAKGYADSDIVTVSYKVKSNNFTISGVVWNDTTNENTVADGLMTYGEQGINGITVMLLNTATNNYDETTTTSTINGVAGSYVLTKAKANGKYKVVFQFNGQKYRAYSKVVTNGNQATTTDAFPLITIKNNGAYNTSTNVRLTAANNYNSAIVDGTFSKTYATTSNTYTAAATGVNLALQTNVYGNLKLAFGSVRRTENATGLTTTAGTNGKVYSNDKLEYTFTVTNNSTQKLKSALVNIYLNNNLSLLDIREAYSYYTTSYSQEGSTNTYTIYRIEVPEIEAGETVTYTITAKVNLNLTDGTGVTNYADVYEYTYTSSCYDKSSIPGNFSYAVRENDEAQTIQLLAYSDVTSAQDIKWSGTNDFMKSVGVGAQSSYSFSVINGTANVDEIYVNYDANVVSCQVLRGTTDNDYVLLVVGKNVGTTPIQVSLKRDASKNIKFNLTVA